MFSEVKYGVFTETVIKLVGGLFSIEFHAGNTSDPLLFGSFNEYPKIIPTDILPDQIPRFVCRFVLMKHFKFLNGMFSKEIPKHQLCLIFGIVTEGVVNI